MMPWFLLATAPYIIIINVWGCGKQKSGPDQIMKLMIDDNR